jgi:hypothetical protein
MRDDRVQRVLRPSLALTALAAVVVLLGLVIAGPAHATTRSPTPAATRTATPAAVSHAPTAAGAVAPQRGTEVRFGEDVVVAKSTRVPSVVTFGGDILVNGRVADSVVAFGGNVTVNGTVGMTVVAFGGNVTLGPNAVVGRDLTSTDASIVLFGGDLTKSPGAEVVGQTKSFKGVNLAGALGWAGRGLLFNPLLGFSFFGWVVQTAFFLVLALVAAALMPRQLRGLQRQLAQRPWASLGWGALAFFVAVPAILVVLVISIVGLLLVLPYALFVLLAYFFVTTGVAAFLAQKVLTGFGGKENLMLAVTIGVIGTTVVSRIPVIGPVLLVAMMVLGAGAAILGFADWRRGRREAAAAQAVQAAAAAIAAGGVTAAAPAPAVITPIVQTSPPQTVAAEPAVPTVPATETETPDAAAPADQPVWDAPSAPRQAEAAAPAGPESAGEDTAGGTRPAVEGGNEQEQPAT